MNNEQIFELMDRAQSNICNNTVPKEHLEASVTYDYATMMYEQSQQCDIELLQQMRDPSEKASRMKDAGVEMQQDYIEQTNLTIDGINEGIDIGENGLEIENETIDIDELCAEENFDVDLDELCPEENMEIDLDMVEQSAEMDLDMDGGIGDLLNHDGNALDIGLGDGAESGVEAAEQAIDAAVQALERVMGG